MSYRAIARELDIAENTVRARVRRMEESDTMRVVAVTDIEAAGYGMLLAIGVQVEGRSPEKVARELADIPEVFSVNNTLVYAITSDDEGSHWSTPTDLTPSVKERDEGWVATGPSNAIVLSSGRVLVPMDSNVGAGSIAIDYQLVPGPSSICNPNPDLSLASSA